MPKLSPEAVRRLVTALRKDDDNEDDEPKQPARKPEPVKVAPTKPFAVAFKCKLTRNRYEFRYEKKDKRR